MLSETERPKFRDTTPKVFSEQYLTSSFSEPGEGGYYYCSVVCDPGEWVGGFREACQAVQWGTPYYYAYLLFLE